MPHDCDHEWRRQVSEDVINAFIFKKLRRETAAYTLVASGYVWLDKRWMTRHLLLTAYFSGAGRASPLTHRQTGTRAYIIVPDRSRRRSIQRVSFRYTLQKFIRLLRRQSRASMSTVIAPRVNGLRLTAGASPYVRSKPWRQVWPVAIMSVGTEWILLWRTERANRTQN